MSHMIVPTITLLGTLNFYLLFKFNIYKKKIDITNITLDSTNITYISTYITFNSINWVDTIPTKKTVNIVDEDWYSIYRMVANNPK